MNATTVAVDLAKNVYQLAVADPNWRVIEKHRLTRAQFERFFANRSAKLVVMEACGSAHFWARHLQALGMEVRLLPPRYIRAYVKRNKTDAADAAALLEAARCADIVPVRIKSVEQQALQSLHRVRMGRISKLGDSYLRVLLTHGARSVIHAATMKRRAGRPLDRLRSWALELEARGNRNKAVCALANKMARICYATLRDQEPYGAAKLERKLEHTAFKRAC